MEIEATSTTNDYHSTGPTGSQRPKKKRIRNWTAEDRAVHREFEKSRREAFSERLMVGYGRAAPIRPSFANRVQELTTLLPMLKDEQRPSKHIIVDASISHHKAQNARYLQATRTIHALMAERDDLLREVNGLRVLCQPGACVPRQVQPIGPAVLEVLADSDELAARPVSSSNRSFPKGPSPNFPHEAFMPGASGSAPAVEQISHPLRSGHPPGPVYTLTDPSWNDPYKHARPPVLPADLTNDAPLLWNQSPDTATTTPSTDMELGYDANASHIVDNAALFWSQHPGGMTTTPPRDHDLLYNTSLPDATGDNAVLWSHNLAINTATPLPNGDPLVAQQIFQSASSFSNPEILSI